MSRKCCLLIRSAAYIQMQSRLICKHKGKKIFQCCTCPAGRDTYNFHSSCKHTHLSFKSVCNKEHMGVIWLSRVILAKALVSVPVYAVIISKYATKIVGMQKRQVACVHGTQDQKQSTFNTVKPAQS